jgi:hypothetical protein
LSHLLTLDVRKDIFVAASHLLALAWLSTNITIIITAILVIVRETQRGKRVFGFPVVAILIGSKAIGRAAHAKRCGGAVRGRRLEVRNEENDKIDNMSQTPKPKSKPKTKKNPKTEGVTKPNLNQFQNPK